MRVAIMQPYLFPYIGYFQLINAVDAFVIYDDVNYITRGWINRNRILQNGRERLFTLKLEKASQNKLIRDIRILNEPNNRLKILDCIRQAYRKSPQFKDIIPVIEEIISNREEILSRYILNSLKILSEHLWIDTRFLMSSEIEKNNSLKGKDKILEITTLLKAHEYINPIGGVSLYKREEFEKKGIKLSFLTTREIVYTQQCSGFIPNLSIIDVLMNNPKDTISTFLRNYEFI